MQNKKSTPKKPSVKKSTKSKPKSSKRKESKPKPEDPKQEDPKKQQKPQKEIQQKEKQQSNLRKRASSTPKKQTPILSKNDKPKPLFLNKVVSSEETVAIKQTLATLRALFGSETLPYYDQFPLEPHRTCCALVFTAICCLIKICLYGLIIAMTIMFHIDTLNYLLDDFESVYEDSDIPAVPGAIIQTLHSLCIGIYAFCSLAILVDISLIAASFLRHIRAISISIAIGFFVNFWAIFFMFSIAVAGFNHKDLTSSFMGNLALRDFELSPTGRVIHDLQEQFECCGFEGPKDWHKRTMFHWEEPGIEEDRTLPYPLHWLEKCATFYVCYSPKSCCTSESLKKPNSTCNQANMTKDAFNDLVDRDFNLLSKQIKPKYNTEINGEGCVDKIGERLKDWSIYALAVSTTALILWIFITVLLTLSLSEFGYGSVNPRTSLVDPSSLKDIVPFGAMLDEMCCCGGGNVWPIVDDLTEMEAIREDRRALIAIEEGKPLRDMDLTASTSNIALFLPSMKELRRFDDSSGIEQPEKPNNEQQKK